MRREGSELQEWFLVALIMAEECAAWLRHAAANLDGLEFSTAGEKAAVLEALTRSLWESAPGGDGRVPGAGATADGAAKDGGAAQGGAGGAGRKAGKAGAVADPSNVQIRLEPLKLLIQVCRRDARVACLTAAARPGPGNDGCPACAAHRLCLTSPDLPRHGIPHGSQVPAS